VSQQTTNQSFDELTRGLASGSISRSKAIRLMGAALVGGTLASFPGVGWAAKGGRSSCAQFCQSLFGANTPEEAKCVSQGTKGQGPCFTCTTSTGCGPNFTKLTCTEVPGQTYSCATCQCGCPSGQVVCGGRCGTSNGGSCATDNQCCSGICDGGTCSTCRDFGGGCAADSDCCYNICDGGTCSTCRSGNGGGCADDNQCCDSFCVSGTCRFCRPNGSTCTRDAECCMFCDGGICAECRGAGAFCGRNSDCCSNVCEGGVCLGNG